jgi:outer membrane protein OmpA-like peptidoglycan-associated protein
MQFASLINFRERDKGPESHFSGPFCLTGFLNSHNSWKLMKKMKNVFSVVALVLTIFIISGAPQKAWARATSASANTFLPAIDDSRYLSIYGSQTLQQWQFRTGLYLNYANDPLEVGLAGVRRFGVIDHLIVGDFFGSVGFTDWFELGLNVPVALYEDFNDIATGTSQKTFRTMDVRLEGKFRLLDIDRHNIGLAVIPYVFFPTGSGSRFVGNNSFAGGVKGVLDFDIADRVQVALNVGYLMRDRVVILNTEKDDELTYGLGVSVRTVKNWLDLIAEVYGNTNVTELFERESEMPLEVDFGMRFNLPRPTGLQITAGGGVGLTFGYGTPDYRAILGVSYLKPRRVDLPTPPPPPEEVVAQKEDKSIVITKKIHFEFDKSIIRPISFRILDAVVDIIKSNPSIAKIRIEGHTDSKGTDAYNDALSQRRANAVREYLIAHGVESSRLVAVGYGEKRPVDTNDTAEGRARNRRVEFTIVE